MNFHPVIILTDQSLYDAKAAILETVIYALILNARFQILELDFHGGACMALGSIFCNACRFSRSMA